MLTLPKNVSPSTIVPMRPRPEATSLGGPFEYGAQGTIEYKPNWGQPIGPQGEWGDQTPQAAFDPGELLETHLSQLRTNFEKRYKTLEAADLDDTLHNRAVAEMQEEYDQAKAKITGVQSQLNFIQSSVASGMVDPVAGQEAMARLVLPAGVVDTMFPEPARQPTPGVTGTTPSAYNALAARFKEAGKATLVNPPGKWRGARNIVSPKKLKKLYKRERQIANLNDPRNIGRVAGFNQAFVDSISTLRGGLEAIDELMGDEPRWFAPSSRLGSIVNGKIDGRSVSPLARSVVPKQSKFKSIDITTLGDEELRRIAGVQ